MRCLLGCVLLAGVGSLAEAQEIRGVYAGLAVGSFSYEDNGSNLGVRFSDRANGYRILGGYQFNSIYGLEAVWGNSGEFRERFSGFDPAVGNVSLDVAGEYQIATLRFVAMAPVSNLGMFGGIGYYDATLDASYRFRSPVETLTATDEIASDGLTVIGGIQHEFRRFAVRGEYEWFDTRDGVDANSFNVIGIFRF